MSRLVVTIDGPAASGKSTVARLLAEKLNAAFLDTGICIALQLCPLCKMGRTWLTIDI